MNKKEKKFVEQSDDPVFYTWLIEEMGGKVKNVK